MKINKKFCLLVVLLGGILLFLGSTLIGIWSEYGGVNLRIALAQYVEENDGKWPRSWEDIEPYHRDPVLGVKSTLFVRNYWGVAWNLDLEEVIHSNLYDDEELTPVVYQLDDFENGDMENVRHWDLGEKLRGYYSKSVE